jgi:hypothetical protein
VTPETIRLSGRPERIFVSVDERTGRSTTSFMPREVSAPIVREDDAKGEHALVAARAIAASHPGCAIEGPHFHASRAEGAPKSRRPPRRP